MTNGEYVDPWDLIVTGDWLINERTHQGARVSGVHTIGVGGYPMRMFGVMGRWYNGAELREAGWRSTDATVVDNSPLDIGW